ncbi:cell adhesion molecule CEACAM7-like isoform 2-T2 [Dama dama]
MEPPSGPASRRHVPWNRLLLAVSLLTFRHAPTTAQLTIETVPPLAAEGTDVLLLAHNVSENPLGYTWYRGERVENSQLIASYRPDTNVTTKGPAHSGRETFYPSGTLLIQHVTQKDTGSYTLLILKNDLQNERQIGHLQVHPVLHTPVITSNNSNPWEHKDTVVLTCGPETQDTSYMWWINDQSLPSSTRLELSEDKRTLTVFSVTRKDTGPYVCEARNPVSVRRSDPFTLKVLWQENTQALNVGTIVGIVIGLLLVLTLVAALGCFLFLHRGNWPPASTSGRGPSGGSVSQASLPDARSPAPIYQTVHFLAFRSCERLPAFLGLWPLPASSVPAVEHLEVSPNSPSIIPSPPALPLLPLSLFIRNIMKVLGSARYIPHHNLPVT